MLLIVGERDFGALILESSCSKLISLASTLKHPLGAIIQQLSSSNPAAPWQITYMISPPINIFLNNSVRVLVEVM